MSFHYSVVIPTYNRADIVAESVDSVLQQKIQPEQIIIVDDASTDHTDDIIRPYIQMHDHISYMKHDSNKGVSAARNFGAKHVTSDWVLFLDSDDIWVAEASKKIQDFIRDEACTDKAQFISGKFRIVFKDKTLGPIKTLWEGENPILPILKTRNAFAPSWTIVRRDILQAINGFDENLRGCSDWDFYVRAAKQGANFAYLPKLIAHYRTPPGDRIMNDKRMNEYCAQFLKKHDFEQQDLVPNELFKYL